MLKAFLGRRKKAINYFKNHVEYNAFAHVLGGIGLGIIMASPFADPHPIRWGITLIIISLIAHFYASALSK